jgi:hypothetical protein
MATIILNHRVADFDKWKPYYDADSPRRKAAGLREIKVGRKAGDPNNVFIIWEAPNTSDFQKMANDQDLRKLREKAGVINEPEVTILD